MTDLEAMGVSVVYDDDNFSETYHVRQGELYLGRVRKAFGDRGYHALHRGPYRAKDAAHEATVCDIAAVRVLGNFPSVDDAARALVVAEDMLTDGLSYVRGEQ
jgi:hypothetical protein